jgi:uncharacterized membrane protein
MASTHNPLQQETIAEIEQQEEKLRSIEGIISVVLRGGVIISGGIILLGVILFFAQHGALNADVTKLAFPHDVGSVFTQAFHGSAEAVIMLGLMALIATPVSRIAISIFAFAFERDWRYAAITALVLIILIVSFALGKAG